METFTPSLNWGDELIYVPVVGGAGLGDRSGVHPRGAGAVRAVHHLGVGSSPITGSAADCIAVSVSHRSTVEQHHDRRLELLGGGQWRLAPV